MLVDITLLGLTIPSHGESSRHGCTCVHTRCAGRSARQTSCSRTRKARALFTPPFSLLNPRHSWSPRTLPPQNKNACSVFSAFFRKGQVIETFRGAGIYQPAVDLAIERLRAGAWVCVPFLPQSFVRACSSSSSALKPPARVVTQIHLFAEGKVCQSDTYKADPQTGIARLQRFEWGMCASSFLSQTTEPYSDLNIILSPPHANHKHVVLTLPLRRRYHDNRPPSAVAS